MNPTALIVSVSVIALSVLAGAPARAQQTTGTPGSPGATTTLSGKQLPPPDPKFGGVIKQTASESQAWWAPRATGALPDPREARLRLENRLGDAARWLPWMPNRIPGRQS